MGSLLSVFFWVEDLSAILRGDIVLLLQLNFRPYCLLWQAVVQTETDSLFWEAALAYSFAYGCGIKIIDGRPKRR